MSDEKDPETPLRTVRKLWLRRSPQSGTFYPREMIDPSPRAPAPENNHVLRQLQGLRQENKAILENHLRDRELIVRLGERVEQGFDNVRADIRQLRDEVKVLRSEVLSLENKLLNNQNEILAIVRRLDEAESEPFEIITDEDADDLMPTR